MQLEIMEHDEHLLVSAVGEILWDSCTELRQTVLNRIGAAAERGPVANPDAPPQGKYTQLWLDLSDTKMIDSVSLGVLMGIRMSCHNHGVRMSLVAPSKQVLSTLQAVKFDALFEIVDRETAQAAVLDAK